MGFKLNNICWDKYSSSGNKLTERCPGQRSASKSFDYLCEFAKVFKILFFREKGEQMGFKDLKTGA